MCVCVCSVLRWKGRDVCMAQTFRARCVCAVCVMRAREWLLFSGRERECVCVLRVRVLCFAVERLGNVCMGFAGPARTVTCNEDLLSVVVALRDAQPGEVCVCSVCVVCERVCVLVLSGLH